MKDIIVSEINKIRDELVDINDFMYNHPELGNEEFKSSKLLMDILKEHGFSVESNIGNQKPHLKEFMIVKKMVLLLDFYANMMLYQI